MGFVVEISKEDFGEGQMPQTSRDLQCQQVLMGSAFIIHPSGMSSICNTIKERKNTDCPLRRRASRRIGESVPCRWGGTCYHGYLFVELLPVLVLLGVWIAAWHTEMKAFTVLHHTDGKTEANTGKA